MLLSLFIPLGPLAAHAESVRSAAEPKRVKKEVQLDSKVQPVVLLGGGVGALTPPFTWPGPDWSRS